MMVVTLTNSSSFDTKEGRAFAILHRLNIREEIKHKASFVVASVVKILALQKKWVRKEITREQYLDAKIHYRNSLEIRKEKFNQIKNEMKDFEISQEELMRQLMERIDQDFEDIKYLTDGLKEIESQLLAIRNSQNAVLTTLEASQSFTQELKRTFGPFFSAALK